MNRNNKKILDTDLHGIDTEKKRREEKNLATEKKIIKATENTEGTEKIATDFTRLAPLGQARSRQKADRLH